MEYMYVILEYVNIIWNKCTTDEFNTIEGGKLVAAPIITELRKGLRPPLLMVCV
jgi:hypothetical protein